MSCHSPLYIAWQPRHNHQMYRRLVLPQQNHPKHFCLTHFLIRCDNGHEYHSFTFSFYNCMQNPVHDCLRLHILSFCCPMAGCSSYYRRPVSYKNALSAGLLFSGKHTLILTRQIMVVGKRCSVHTFSNAERQFENRVEV